MATDEQHWMQSWVNLIHAATHLRRGLEERLRKELGIGLSEQDLLKQLEVNGGRLTLTELGQRIYFSKAGITKMLDRLEHAQFVERQAMPGDRRSLSARLTTNGAAALRQSQKIVQDYVQSEFRDALSEREIMTLSNILEKILRSQGVWEGQQKHLRGQAGPE